MKIAKIAKIATLILACAALALAIACLLIEAGSAWGRNRPVGASVYPLQFKFQTIYITAQQEHFHRLGQIGFLYAVSLFVLLGAVYFMLEKREAAHKAADVNKSRSSD